MSLLARLHERLSPLGNARARGDGGPIDRAAARARLPLDRRFLAGVGAFEGLGTLGASVAAAAPAADGLRVLVVGLRGIPDHTAYEAVIAQALRMRGADVTFAGCGGGQPVCEIGWSRRAAPRPCDRCAWHVREVAGRSGLPLLMLGDALPWGSDGRAAPQRAADPDDEALARSHISAAWFQRSSRPLQERDGTAVVHDFAIAAAGAREAWRRVLDDVRPDVVFAMNGLFAAERMLRAEAADRGLRAPTYEIAPRSGSLVFSQDAPAPDYDNDEAWAQVGDRPLSGGQRERVQGLLDDRARGVGAHERYFDAPEERADALRAQLGIPAGGRVVSVFTNLSWDSATIDKDLGFDSMFAWVCEAVAAAAQAPGTTLVVRVHPAETRWESRESTEAFVRDRFPRLPENVRFVGPDTPLSSYALLDLSDLVCVYTTTVGLEAATRGLRVAVAGLTHYRARGFTHDVAGPEELATLIRGAARGPLTDHERDLALRYAYTFFYRCSIPFPLVRVESGRVSSVPTAAAEIAPGAEPRLDWVCDRILDGGSFVLPDELAGLP